jgi:hypothetical protein
MKRTLMYTTGILATVPGLAPLIGFLPTPPGQKAIFVTVAEFLGVAVILLLWTWRKRILRMGRRSTTRISAFIVLVFFLAFGASEWLHTVTLASEEGRTTVFVPLCPGENLRYMINEAGSVHMALIRYGSDALVDASQETPGWLAITTVLLLLAHEVMLLAPVVLCCGLALKTDGTGFALMTGKADK